MEGILLLVAAILLLCILADKCSGKFGMPALILFIGVGMLFGSDGIVKIPFDNFEITEQICTVALGFIMFYGGFNTKWKAAKPVAVKSLLLSTVGVFLTAMLTMGFCCIVLKFPFAEGFLLGAVLSCTDAASVFAILRKKKLNLKDGVASLLEIESGSNDPAAYMLTVIGISLVNGENLSSVPYAIFAQIVYGVLLGVGLAFFAVWLLTRTNVISNSMYTVFLLALVLLGLGVSSLVGGNGYLCIYLLGIILGNSKISNKKDIIPFFDGVTGLSQILIFFLLGLLSFPHKLPDICATAVVISLFLLVIARPVTVTLLLKPFGCSLNQCFLVAWAGLRGASSIVFSIFAMAAGNDISRDLFHIVFMVSLISVALQGTLLPYVADKLNMIDENVDVRKTFNDYQEESAITLMRMYIPKGHNWENKRISEVHMPTGALALMIKRNRETIITRGNTKILADDTIILSVPTYEPGEDERLEEIFIEKAHEWCDATIEELKLPENVIIALIKRDEENIIPDGQTRILENDVVVVYQ
jgi:cell volume regulation protein A